MQLHCHTTGYKRKFNLRIFRQSDLHYGRLLSLGSTGSCILYEARNGLQLQNKIKSNSLFYSLVTEIA
jgi:hypothetical protein